MEAISKRLRVTAASLEPNVTVMGEQTDEFQVGNDGAEVWALQSEQAEGLVVQVRIEQFDPLAQDWIGRAVAGNNPGGVPSYAGPIERGIYRARAQMTSETSRGDTTATQWIAVMPSIPLT